MKKLVLTILAVFYVCAAFAQQGIKVEVHNVVAADEQFNLTFIIEGEERPEDFSWSPGNDFQLLWGPQQGHSTSISIVNGKRTKSVQSTYTYVLKPLKTGKFTIAPASASLDGKTINSSPVTIEVASSGKPSSGSDAAVSGSRTGMISDSDVFLEMSLSRRDVVIGEPITAAIKLYQRVNIAGVEGVSFPTFNGFWSQETEAPANIEFVRETYGGQIYNVALLRKFVLIPQQQGVLTINPAELVCLVNIRVSPSGANIFDGFFDDYRTIRKRVSTSPVNVKVSPLPSGAPSSFGGGVGEFKISAVLSRDSLKTHEAASLIITLSGTGNVSLLEAPHVNFPPDMEVYDTKISEKVDRNGLGGSKTYEYPFIPRSHGDFIIEPVNYAYYDVDQKKYVTLQTSELSLNVARGNETESSAALVPGVSQKDVRTLSSDIRFITTGNPHLSVKGAFLVGSVTFWAVILLLSLAAVIVLLLLRRISARRADVVGTRNRKATKMALKRLRLAETFLKQNLYTAFYEELHKALSGFISDKLNIPVAELSRDRISEALKRGNVSDGLVGEFIALLDSCEFARYSPDGGNDAMAVHYRSALEVISSIDSYMKPGKSDVRKSVLAVLLLVIVPSLAGAHENIYVDSLWNAANTAYMEGRWADAVSGYEAISDMGLESAALFCNAGDASFKDENFPKAVLYYERALKLDPSYEDARYNLELLNERIQDNIDPVPEFILKVWVRNICWLLDSDSWTIVFFVLFALTLAMILLFILSPSVAGRRTGFFTALVTVFLAMSSLAFACWQKDDYLSEDYAVVMTPVSSVKSSPSAESSKDLFILHEGTKVKVLDKVGAWSRIELADGRQGWMPERDIEII